MITFKKQIVEIVSEELVRANRKFPQFSSMHEGYAVIREELEETESCLKSCETNLEMLWFDTRANEAEKGKDAAEEIFQSAISAACEAIQLAAMAKKFQRIGADHEVPEVRKESSET